MAARGFRRTLSARQSRDESRGNSCVTLRVTAHAMVNCGPTGRLVSKSMDNPLRHPPGVPRVEKPRAEGQFLLADGRRLGYAEFGDPTGPVVLWFHGTLGARRQFPMLGRRAAERLGLRVILIERPGTGLSDAHRYGAVTDWVPDMAQVVDALDAERLGVVG